MSGIVNGIVQTVGIVKDGVIGLIDEAVKMTDVIMSNKNKKGDNSEFVPFHGDGDVNEMKGQTYDPVARYINEKCSDLPKEQAQQLYNTIKNGIDKAKILMEKCDKEDLQFRIVRLDSTRDIKEGKNDVMIETGSSKFEKAKDIYKSASDSTYLGGLMVVKNLSNNNGDSLEIASCSIIPNGADMTDPNNYDGEDNTCNIYNKEVYTRFVPSTSTIFYTKSIGEIASQYSLRDDWEEKKPQILAKIAEAMGITVEQLKNDGQNIRCISRISQLQEQGIDSFDSLRQNSAGFTIGEKYAGPNIVLLNKYFKFKTSGDTTKYQITLFEMFLTGKSNNLNASADLLTEKKYTISNLNEEKVQEIITNVLEGRPDNGKFNELVIKQRLRMHGDIVVKNGKFVRAYNGEQLQKGEEVLEPIGEVFDF